MQAKIGILLVNLGTPDSPQPKDVKKYLTEFLTDGRVIDRPWLLRQLLVRGLIVPQRYRTVAHSYQQIWQKQGSPLLSYGQQLKQALQSKLGDSFLVELGMRYQNPSMEKALKALLAAKVGTVVVLPLFPQYASATTGTVQQKVMELIKNQLYVPKMVFIDHFFDREDVLDCFCTMAQSEDLSASDLVIFSFHGLPKRHLRNINARCFSCQNCCQTLGAHNHMCYAAQCYCMAERMAKKLNLPKDKYQVCFQSRLGKEPWLEPYLSDVIQQAASHGHKKLLVFSPSFVCDCLETLYEIGIEYNQAFQKAGGEKITLVPGLNVHPTWVAALKALINEHILAPA